MTTTKLLRVLLLCPVFMLVIQQTRAQNKTVTGKVSDEKGAPVAGASVLAKGSKSGTSTDATGSFSLSVPTAATTLVITYVGYASEEVAIPSSNNVTVALKPESTALTDVVVIGYGTVRKKDLTGAVASVKEKDFNKGTITSPDQLLQNKVPGLEVTSNSGQPGAATTVKIRGNNSIRGGNNPIYVIDGVILDGRTARPSVTSGSLGATPESNPLIYINPNDIASIDVLKDASATAIYGSRGANGVIAITTKKGSSGPSKLEFATSFGVFAGYMKKYEVLDAGQYRSALTKYNVTNAADLDGKQNIDPQDEIVSDALSQNYSLAFSGGNETGKFRASFLASETQGFVKETSLGRYLGNFGGSYKFLDKKLTLDFDLIAGHTTEQIGAVTNNAGSQGNLVSSLLEWNPTMSFTDASGHYVFPTNGSGNPLALIAGVNDEANVNTYLANISASYKIFNSLEYKFLYAINHGAGTRNTNYAGWMQGYAGLSGLGFGMISHAALTSQTFTHTLNYNGNILNNLSLNATGGFEYWKSNYSTDNFSGTGFNTNLTQDNIIDIPYTAIMQDAKTQNPPSTYIDPTVELQSYFVRAILNYNDRFFITGTFRADGSSKFGENNKYGYFPSVAGKWIISNEGFIRKGGLISTLAVRASWGKTGNQEFPAGASQEQFGFTAYNNASQQNVANPNLRWETTTSYNFGLDYGLLNGRIYGAFDYYDKKTTDILFQSIAIQPAPASTYWINIPGELGNKGFEFSVGAAIIQGKDFAWDLTFNIANNKNLLTNFYAPGTKTPIVILTGEISGQGVSGTLSQIITNDQPVNEYYLKPFKGFDADGNQIIGTADEITFAGDPNPHTLYGISTTLRFRKLSLTLNGGGASGFLIYNNTRTNITNIGGIIQGRNMDQAAYDSPEKPTSGAAVSTRFLEKGDYLKLRNVALNWNVGNVSRYIKGLNIFVNASNLFVMSEFSGFDPEVNIDKSSGGYPSRSIEYVPYPTPRMINFGLSFSL